jgi:hypothetical protein
MFANLQLQMFLAMLRNQDPATVAAEVAAFIREHAEADRPLLRKFCDAIASALDS